MKNIRLILIGVIFLSILSACANVTTTEKPTAIVTTETTQAYPGPLVNTGDPAYPAAKSTPIRLTPRPTFTPDAQMGSVTGTLLLKDEPIQYLTLYLAKMIKDKTGRNVVASLNKTEAPVTKTDDQGKFAFINVAPGTYALIMDVGVTQSLLKFPGEEKAVIVEVVAGKLVELEKLNYSDLPMPNK